MTPDRRRDAALAVVGSLLVLAALVIIWSARAAMPRELYVSELGAVGEPTAEAFRTALLLIVAGGTLVAWAVRDLRARAVVLRRGTPALSLAVACAAFFVAAQVPCTLGCPLPVGDTFTLQDFTHTLSAVIAFAAACWAMLQVAFAPGHRAISRMSLAMAIAVAVIAGLGGLMSLFRWNAHVGSHLEFVATTVGIGWLVVVGLVRAARLLRTGARGAEPAERSRQTESSIRIKADNFDPRSGVMRDRSRGRRLMIGVQGSPPE